MHQMSGQETVRSDRFTSTGAAWINVLKFSKCTGERPCTNCLRTDIVCRYAIIPQKRPRIDLLEERVGEYELLG